MSLPDELQRIFDADRVLHEAESVLLRKKDSEELIALLRSETDSALRMEDRKEGTMRLERLADLCAQVPGPDMADALIAILNDEEPRVRVAAGEALRDLGYERYAEVARGIERVHDVPRLSLGAPFDGAATGSAVPARSRSALRAGRDRASRA